MNAYTQDTHSCTKRGIYCRVINLWHLPIHYTLLCLLPFNMNIFLPHHSRDRRERELFVSVGWLVGLFVVLPHIFSININISLSFLTVSRSLRSRIDENWTRAVEAVATTKEVSKKREMEWIFRMFNGSFSISKSRGEMRGGRESGERKWQKWKSRTLEAGSSNSNNNPMSFLAF